MYKEFNISFALILRKWKMVLNNLTLGTYETIFYLQYPIHSYILHDFTFKLDFFPENLINWKRVYNNILLNRCHCYIVIQKYRIFL